MFVWPVYSQSECSGDTTLVLFLHPFTASAIDGSRKYALWPIYLLCSLSATLALWIRLVLSSSHRAHELLSRQHFATKDQARRAIAVFIDAYNHRRRHSSCEMLPPVTYETVLAQRAAETAEQEQAA